MPLLSPQELYQFNVVLVGSFNTPLFSPAFFKEIGLFSLEELDRVKTLAQSQNLMQFKLDDLDFIIQNNRFMVQNPKDEEPKVIDFISKTFEKLYYTPINLIGFNYSFKRDILDSHESVLDELISKNLGFPDKGNIRSFRYSSELEEGYKLNISLEGINETSLTYSLNYECAVNQVIGAKSGYYKISDILESQYSLIIESKEKMFSKIFGF